jgi:hypothetical protein
LLGPHYQASSLLVEVGQSCKQQWIIKKGPKKKVRPGVVVNIKNKDSTPG